MLNDAFYQHVNTLYNPGMGTEQVAPMLYHLLRMLRPRNVLEIGMGYTTPFILQALADNQHDIAREQRLLRDPASTEAGRNLLLPEFYTQPYHPTLLAIDDFSQTHSTAPQVLDVIATLGLSAHLKTIKGVFQGASTQIAKECLPIDFIWLDCGGTENSAAFFNEYWPLLHAEGGHLALHFTQRWQLARHMEHEEETMLGLFPGSVLRELRVQIREEMQDSLELLTLVEPHKWWQGSMTLLRRVPTKERLYDLGERPFGRTVPAFSLKSVV